MRARLAVVALLLLAAPAGAEAPPPEPAGYRTEAYRAPTPATLRGARVVTTAEAEALWRAGSPFIDVLPLPPRPAALPAGTIWRDPPHDSIPGARWLANTGFGALAPETDAYFRRELDAATKGDRARPMVFFCQRHCWMSWNAAKRALAHGYTSVHWYPDGTDGWAEATLPLERAEPVAP
ncbi:PQQ-dependent catabolism-associated CXXCW motif protein [uncultured Methylobacterium sp.]|uniref:PQQ-dependent catabolism-associated CXXCW motif protein n=1 Tax=uncultured Methylobacterium sp. TaxID=157278 RepID=UPI002606E3B0|nr:PQQ-dependent catabolism-associated CXXCW motif protein [uncultured Methylobacterium sp.]